MNKFVEILIATRDDGHAFFPYREQSEFLNRTPTKDDICLFVEAMVEMKFEDYAAMMRGDPGYEEKAKVASMAYAYRKNPVYREKSLNAAVEYIFDEGFVFGE